MEIDIVTSDLTNLVANTTSTITNIAFIDIFVCFLLTLCQYAQQIIN